MGEFTEIALDGCCGEGGGARGLVRAGHYVVGVDINPKLRDGYLRSGAHEFVCADILDVLEDKSFLSRFTFTTQHPPCQGYSGMMNCQPPEVRARYPRLILPILARLAAHWGGRPWTIENVEGARNELPGPATWCMWMFGRHTYRHRLIAASAGLHMLLRPPEPPAWAWSPPTAAHRRTRIVRRNPACGWPHPVPTARAGHWEPGMFVSVAGHERRDPVRAVMEIDWMSDREAVAEAIPWYLGAEIARQLAAWRAGQETAA